jgi:hypothetical protein
LIAQHARRRRSAAQFDDFDAANARMRFAADSAFEILASRIDDVWLAGDRIWLSLAETKKEGPRERGPSDRPGLPLDQNG